MVKDIRTSDGRWWCNGCFEHQIIKTSDSGVSRCERCANVLADRSFSLNEYAAFLCHLYKGRFRTDTPHPVPYKFTIKSSLIFPDKLLDSRFDFVEIVPKDDKDTLQESEKEELQTSPQAEEAMLKILKI